MIPIRSVLTLAAMLAAGAAQAQTPARPEAAPQAAAAQRCTVERAHVEAEETTPGILRDLMREALRACLAAAGQPATTAAAAGAPGVGR